MITYTLEATDFNLIATFNFTQVLPQRPLKETNSDSENITHLFWTVSFIILNWEKKAASYSSASKKKRNGLPTELPAEKPSKTKPKPEPEKY